MARARLAVATARLMGQARRGREIKHAPRLSVSRTRGGRLARSPAASSSSPLSLIHPHSPVPSAGHLPLAAASARRSMGQALRRASGRVRPPPPASSPSAPARQPPPPPRAAPAGGASQDRLDAPSGDDTTTPTKNVHGVLEERDPSYDERLKHMVGRITTKPGGKPEMGEASVGERYNRPLPKVRTSKAEPGQSGGKQLPSGALNVQHIQEIIQLYQGKSANHQGPMSVDDIASRFRVEASVVQNIVQFVSLPQDETVKKKDEH